MTSRFHRDGIQFCYEKIGAGAPLVMSHGLGGNRNQPKDLCGRIARHQVVVLDARAHGDTEPVGPEKALTFDRFAGDLCALMDHLEIERAVIGGISMGAGVSTRFALNFPDRTEALILVRPAWEAEPSPKNLELLPMVAEALEQAGNEKGREIFSSRPEILCLRAQAPAVAESILQQFDKPLATERRARLQCMPADCPIRSWSDAEGISVPTLVVGNAEDPMHPLQFAEAWAAKIPDATLAVIPSKSESEASHIAAFRQALNAFLSNS